MPKTKIPFFILIILLFLIAGPVPVFAQGSNQNQLVPTGFERICKNEGGELALAKCIQQIYLFSLGFASLMALFMLVLAGYRYMTAGGNATQLTDAKDAFSSAFIGLIIIFIAFLLLYTINPELVRFRPTQGIGALPLPEYKPPIGVVIPGVVCANLVNLNPITVKNGSQASSQLKNVLLRLPRSDPWQVTEAVPATSSHKDPGHVYGYAVDMAFTHQIPTARQRTLTSQEIARIEAMWRAIQTEAGKGELTYTEDEYRNPSPGATGGHFHLRGKQCPLTTPL